MIVASLQHAQTLGQELILAPATRDIQEMVKHVKVRKKYSYGDRAKMVIQKKNKNVLLS